MNKLKEIWFIYKGRIIAGLILSLLSILLFAGVYFFNIQKISADSIEYQSNGDNIYNKNDDKLKQEKNNMPNMEKVKVDIKGEIKHPGVYELEQGKRVNDVIKLAGGLTSNADTSVTNLSKKLSDEMVIIIYSKKQIESFTSTKNNENEKNKKCKNNEKIINDSCVAINGDSSDKTSGFNSNKQASLININTASLDELMLLSGIGKSKAEAIIDYRNKNGKFSSINDLLNVSGIGQALFEKIKSNITI